MKYRTHIVAYRQPWPKDLDEQEAHVDEAVYEASSDDDAREQVLANAPEWVRSDKCDLEILHVELMEEE